VVVVEVVVVCKPILVFSFDFGQAEQKEGSRIFLRKYVFSFINQTIL
jgi:hypothetical protein